MSTKFFTNDGGNTLLKKFEGVFEHNKDIRFFDALVGFFRASGYFSIRPHLDGLERIRVLVGINVDELLQRYHAQGLLFKGDAGQTVTEFLKEMKDDIQTARYSRKVEDGILQFLEDIASKKLEIKAHPSRQLHAKIYIFRPEPFNEHHSGHVITGSSNLTDAGLGTHDEISNYEFNVLLNDYDDVVFAEAEFEKLWKEAVPILPAELKKVQRQTFLNEEFTPFEVYIKFLIEYFGKSVEFDPSSVTDLPHGFKRLSYQVDAVNQGFEMMKRHNGFFLADVVGLGKTVVATLIAKKFFYTNGYPSHVSRTLIIVPPAMKEAWRETIDAFHLPNARIITNGSLHKVTHPEHYDLVIVDEAHKFRNDTANGYTDLQIVCKTPTERKREDGSKHAKKVMLVSATPLNNRPEDIRNQVYLFQDARDSTLPIANLNNFFAKRIDEYRKAKKLKSIAEVQSAVAKIYERIRQHVIAPLTVRRTRTDLMGHAEYAEDLAAQNITFPDVEKPRRVFYQLPPELEDLFDHTVRILSEPDKGGLTYNRYQAIGYLVPSKKVKYQNADMLSGQLAKIMKTMLVKRLDSSFFAFTQSLTRFRDATAAMMEMWNADRVFIAPNLPVNEYILDDRAEDLLALVIAAQETDPTIEICSRSDFETGFYEGLAHDAELLEHLVTQWEAVEDDPKLNEFLIHLADGLLDPETNPEQKLVVFSESKETSQYLSDALKAAGYDKTLCIHAGNRHSLRETIRANFDANIPPLEQANDVDIVISTEVLAEGVNLHRSNVIVNYDTPWNSTRLMQRIGRVNRIGSVAPRIYNYVFYPTAKVDDDIELQKRAVMKLQAFHSALGEDSQIYSQDEEIGTFGLFDKDTEEERDESLEFLMKLRQFRREHSSTFRKIRNMPLRARCGRRDKTKPQSTLAFIRNRQRDAFYFVGPAEELNELTFVECARQFEAKTHEKAVALHDQHHEQVAQAEADFAEQIQREAAVGKVVDVRQGPQEAKALRFISAVEKLELVGEDERITIKAAMKAVKVGKFQQLVRDINKLQASLSKRKMNNATILDTLMGILSKYPLDDIGEDVRPALSVRGYANLKPDIIISESFAG